jgi:hypothetical protein
VTKDFLLNAMIMMMELNLLRASSTDEMLFPVPKNCGFPRLEKGYSVTRITLNGMAELQREMECDQCNRQLEISAMVFAKGVSIRRKQMLGSFFSPTCVECFAADRGGYYSAPLAFLVMKT